MLPEHKNPIFVSKRPKISEKSPILTQKCQFCARKGRKRGFQTPKAHKNADFVLGGPHRTARSGSAGLTEQHGEARRSTEPVRRDPARQGKTTRNVTRPPGTKRNGPKHNETQPQHNRHATQYTKRNRLGNAKEPLRHGTMGNNKKGDNLSGCLL